MENYRLLSRVALSFLSSGSYESRMVETLEDVGRTLGVSRAYLFEDDPDGRSCSAAFEWCAPGVPPEKEACANLPLSGMPALREALGAGGFVLSGEREAILGELGRGTGPDRSLSTVLYPLYVRQAVRGFIGFDECAKPREWSEIELNILKALSGIVSAALERKESHGALAASEANFKNLFDTIDDLIIIGDGEGRIVHTNRAVTAKLGYPESELASMGILDLHPPGKREEARAILEAMLRRERDECPLELRRKDGGILPVETRVWFGTWNGKPCIFGLCKDLGKEREALQKFEKLFENNPALMAISSEKDHRFVEVNRAFVEKLGFSREEAIGRTNEELGLFPDRDEWLAASECLSRVGRLSDRRLTVRRKDGAILTGLFSGEPVDVQGERYLLSVMVDVSREVELQRELARQRARLENVINGTRLGTWEWNVKTGWTAFNERWAEIIGYRLSELKPISIDTWERFAHPDDLAESNRLLEAHFRGETPFYESESRMRHKDGSWVWVLDRGMVTERDSDGQPLMMYGTHADITERKALEDKVKELSLRDPLTDAYNRRYFQARLGPLLAECRREKRVFSVSMIDIDHFKAINDEHGHLAGDYVLRELTRLLKEGLRPYDFLCRYGGEEFIVASLNADKAGAGAIMGRLLEALRGKTFDFAGKEIRFTFSAGVCDLGEFPPGEADAERLIGLADRRLYRAKREGRNRIETAGE